MEGLAGTAIRLAVRDLSCPQGPGPAWSSLARVRLRGLLPRGAQATTTPTGTTSNIRGGVTACRMLAGINAAGCQDPDLRQEVLIPRDGNGSPSASRHRDSPDPANLRPGVSALPFHMGVDPAAGPAISTAGLAGPVIR